MLPQILQQPKLLNVVTPLIYTPSAVCNRVARDWRDWRAVSRQTAMPDTTPDADL